MHIFLSAGEPSGDLHAANLARHLLAHFPDAKLVGLGGEKMAAAGVHLRYPLTDLAVMWLGKALVRMPDFLRIVRQSEQYFRTEKPDAVVVIDYPGFHFSLAKRAHRAGIPVYYFVPPQLWAWAGWRVSKMRRWVKCVLTALPFEETWYRERGVTTHYIGHPYFDELGQEEPDAEHVAALRAAGTPIVALLPGSRTQEVTSNFPLMVQAAARVHRAVPGVRFHVAAYRNKHAALVREALAGSGLPVEVHVRRTAEILEAADAVLAVSGSVGLEMLYRLKPSVIVYRITPAFGLVARQLVTSKYISLVNLLAGREVFPEFPTTRDNPDELAAPIVRWLTSPAAHRATVEELRALRDRVAVPGACERAAAFLAAELRPG